MQLRTVKKPKNKSHDFGWDNQEDSKPQRRNSLSKESLEKEANYSENENSNLTQENETKSRHKLRNQSNNYQGKYKKMNSGKYLYKLNNSEKKPINKKKQLRFLPYELVGIFKKIIGRLNNKDEENLLSKKKKREESKHKSEGDFKKKSGKISNMNQYYPMNNYDIQNYMMKNPYDFFYQQNMVENLKNQGFPMDDNFYFRMKNATRYTPPDYFFRPGFQNSFSQYEDTKPKPESVLNEERILASEGVNNISAAFYIQSIQKTKIPNKQEENDLTTKRTSSAEGVESSQIAPKNKEEQDPQNSSPDNGKKENSLNPFQSLFHQANSSSQQRKSSFSKIYSDKISSDLNEFTSNQLNTVNDVVKKLKENKTAEITEKHEVQK